MPAPKLTYVEEARIAVESAIAVADLIANNSIVDASFDQLVIFLRDAVEALAKAESAPEPTSHTIFETEELANNHLAGIKPSGNVAYRLARTGDGKWTVQVFKLAGTL
jgi:hypothetical protein